MATLAIFTNHCTHSIPNQQLSKTSRDVKKMKAEGQLKGGLGVNDWVGLQVREQLSEKIHDIVGSGKVVLNIVTGGLTSIQADGELVDVGSTLQR